MTTEELTTLIREFLDKLSVTTSQVHVEEDKVHTLVHISTPDSGILIGMNGENLRALNTVVRKIIERRIPGHTETSAELPILLDVNGYHSRRLEELRNKARMLGERARTFKYDVEMSPMNAYERMIVHATFSEDPEIATESQGEGKFRRVILKYKQNATPAVEQRGPEF